MAPTFRFIGFALTFILITSPLTPLADPAHTTDETEVNDQDDSTNLALRIFQMVIGNTPEKEGGPLSQSGSSGSRGGSESDPGSSMTNASDERRFNGCPISSLDSRGPCKLQTMSVTISRPNCSEMSVNYTLCAGCCPSVVIPALPGELDFVECNLGKRFDFIDTCKPKSFRRKRISLQCKNGEEDVYLRMVKKCQCRSHH